MKLSVVNLNLELGHLLCSAAAHSPVDLVVATWAVYLRLI